MRPEPRGEGGVQPDGPQVPDAPPIRDAPSAAIQFDGLFVGSLSGHSFADFTRHAHDVVVVHLSCSDASEPAWAVTTARPGWTITPGQHGGRSGLWAASFVLVSPDTASATFNVTGCVAQPAAGGDAFANVDLSSPIDAETVNAGTGLCASSLATKRTNDAIWYGCTYSGGGMVSAGGGYTISNNVGGQVTEYKLTTDPAGTTEPATLTGSGSGFVATEVALKPQ